MSSGGGLRARLSQASLTSRENEISVPTCPPRPGMSICSVPWAHMAFWCSRGWAHSTPAHLSSGLPSVLPLGR